MENEFVPSVVRTKFMYNWQISVFMELKKSRPEDVLSAVEA